MKCCEKCNNRTPGYAGIDVGSIDSRPCSNPSCPCHKVEAKSEVCGVLVQTGYMGNGDKRCQNPKPCKYHQPAPEPSEGWESGMRAFLEEPYLYEDGTARTKWVDKGITKVRSLIARVKREELEDLCKLESPKPLASSKTEYSQGVRDGFLALRIAVQARLASLPVPKE